MARRTSAPAKAAVPEGARVRVPPRIRLRGRHVWILASVTLVGLAAVNATVLQQGTHPAPLFAQPRATPGAMSVRHAPPFDAEVRALQSRLQAMGYYEGALDGVMGSGTLDAVYAALDGADALASAVRPARDAPVSSRLPEGDSLTDLLREATAPAPPSRQVVAGEAAIVRIVQERLTERGYDPGPIDGMMGRGTRTAISLFQGDEGLPTTGEIDAPTLARLGMAANG